MSKLLEFILGSVLIAVFTVASLFFSALHFILLSTGEIVDCTWQGSAKTWIDSNGDGRINQGEPPLEGVQVYVDDVKNRLMDISWPVITDKAGDVQFSVFTPECSDTLYEIYVDIPHGYRSTTKARIEVNPKSETSLGMKPVYYFGFLPVK